MAGRPTNGRNRGLYVLNTMKGLVPILAPGLVELWDTVLPKLIHYLEESVESERWNQKNWEDLVLKMLSKSLDVMADEDWVESLGNALNDQISMYNYYPEEKNFLYKCLGIVMRKSAKKDFVARLLDQIFSSVRHSSQLEREGCGIAFGFAAASHLDAVLIKCENVAKNEIGKRQSGILNFLKDPLQKSSDGETEKVKASLMLCYGFVTLYSPPSIIVSRLESTILRSINPHLTGVKDVVVKQNLIRSVELIGKSMHPDHLQTPHTFIQRGDLIKHMLNYIRAESPNHLKTESRALAFSACTTLVKLDPRLPDNEVSDLVKTVINSVLYLPLDGVTLKRGKDEVYEDVLEQEVLMEATMEAMDDLLKVILIKDLTPEGLEAIFKHLYPLTLSPHEHERERALQRALVIFNSYLQTLVVAVGGPSSFSNLGSLLARLTPRCTDPNVEVRKVAIDCLQAVLKIALRYDGKPADHEDSMVEALSTLKDRVKKIDPNTLYSVVSDLSKVLIKKLPTDQLQPFVIYLQDGLTDSESHSSNGTCVVLNSVIKTRGGELHAEVGPLLDDLHTRMPMIVCPQTKTGTLRCIRTLASHHLATTLDMLLSYPLPYDETTVDCWQVLGQDPLLTASVFDYLLDMMQRSLPYEEKRDPRDKRKTIHIATIQPLAATCGLMEMFKVADTEASVKDNFHRLLAALMIRMASMVDAKPPKEEKKDDKKSSKDKKSILPSFTHKDVKIEPSSLSVDTFWNFLVRAQCDTILREFEDEGVWKWLQHEEKYPDAYTMLARLLVTNHPDQVSKVVASLNSILASPYTPQRIMVAAFFSELINQRCGGDMAIVELLMNSLLGRLVDASHRVRMLCIRGLGNVASVGPDQVQKFSTTVLSAMMAGMDDKEDIEEDITLAAMSGLSRVLAEIDEAHIRAILINIALRIRPCFEKEKFEVREAAFTLFGNLSRFGDGPSKAPFLEQIHTNLVSLLLHLNDPEREVAKACKSALRQLGPFIGSDAMNTMFQKHLPDDAQLHYGEFINDLSKIIITDFPDKLNFYVMGNVSFFKSQWPEIRSNAVLFVGFLLGNTPKEKYSMISREHVCGAMILLLKDLSVDVKTKTAEAISLLYDF